MSAETPGAEGVQARVNEGSHGAAARARGQSRSFQRKATPEALSVPLHSPGPVSAQSEGAKLQNGSARPAPSPRASTPRKPHTPTSAVPIHQHAGFTNQAARSPRRKQSPEPFPSINTTAPTASSHFVVQELISGFAIPLPFILLSTIWNTSSHVPLIVPTASHLDGAAPDKPIIELEAISHPSLFSVCLITAGTLLGVGLFGELRNLGRNAKTQTRSSSQDTLSMGTVRRLFGRVFSVGLPYYASSKLGGERVALLLLTSLAADLMSTTPKAENLTRKGGVLKTVLAHKFVLAIMAVQLLIDVTGFSRALYGWSSILGYVAILTSILILPLPYLTTRPRASVVTSPLRKKAQRSQMLAASLDSQLNRGGELPDVQSPLLSTPWDTDLTIASGILAGMVSVLILLTSPDSAQAVDQRSIIGGAIIVTTSAVSFLVAAPRFLRFPGHIGTLAGVVFIAISGLFWFTGLGGLIVQTAVAGLAWLAVGIDSHYQRPRSISTSFGHASQLRRHSHPRVPHSKITGVLLRLFEDWPLLHSILVEKDSRRIFYFMILNFAFMIVQTFYGYVSKSLGLLSDSVHMFFDCVALLVGLAAAVMSKWPPDLRFPYGYGMIDTLAGFANGVFLMLISLEIIYEAIERLAEGVQIQRLTELLIVSTLGLLVNCVGMLAFGHAHHGHGHGHDHGHDHDHSAHAHHHHDSSHTHNHGGHDHVHEDHADGHSHPGHDNSHSHAHAHSHSHSHHHSHSNENMIGIWLHVLADTLGSAAVVVSTILVHLTGWPGFDPLASCLIAILIFGSAVPLVTSTAKRLLLTVPEPTEFDIREALAGVSDLPGIIGVTIPRVWVGGGESSSVQGAMHILVGRNADIDDARARTLEFLRQKDMDILVQVEREGDTRCWCGAAGTTARKGSFT